MDASVEMSRLSRLPKKVLAQRVQEHPRFIWSTYPPIKWTKEELVSELIELGES